MALEKMTKETAIANIRIKLKKRVFFIKVGINRLPEFKVYYKSNLFIVKNRKCGLLFPL